MSKTKTKTKTKPKTKPKTDKPKTDGVDVLRSAAQNAVIQRIEDLHRHYAELLRVLRAATREAENNYRSQSQHADKRMLPPKLAAAVAAMSEVPVIAAEVERLSACRFELSDGMAREHQRSDKRPENEFLSYIEANVRVMPNRVHSSVRADQTELRATARFLQWVESERAVQNYLQVGRLRRAQALVRTYAGGLSALAGPAGLSEDGPDRSPA